MKSIILALILISPMAKAALNPFDQIAAGKDHNCAIDYNGAHCWNGNRYGEANVPVLKNPRKIVASYGITCALDEVGTHCWGNNASGLSNVPPLKNPKDIAVAGFYACAIDDNGVRCWGSSEDDHKVPPTLKNPRQISVGRNHSCALDDLGVQCWGDSQYGQLRVPSLKNPRKIATGGDTSCALDDSGIQCWGGNFAGVATPPALKNPQGISMGDMAACAVDDNGVHCWGFLLDGIQEDQPHFRNPVAVTVGDNRLCALDDEGLQCWGKNWGASVWPRDSLHFGPTFSNPRFYVDEFSTFLRRISAASTKARNELFLNLADFADVNLDRYGVLSKETLANANYLLASLLDSAIRTGDSAYYLSTVIPAYEDSMKANHVAVVPQTALNQQVALKVIQASLSAAKSLLLPDEQAEIQKTIQLVGKAMVNPSEQAVQDVLSTLKTQDGIFAKLNASTKTAFLVSTVKASADWLEGVK
jgi:hypothetical protein